MLLTWQPLDTSNLRVPCRGLSGHDVGVDSKTIRRANLRGVLRDARDTGLNDAEFARKYDLSDRLISQYKNGTRNIGDRFVRALESKMGKPVGWFDTPHYPTAEDRLEAHEAMQILHSLSDKDREAWLKHGRLLVNSTPPLRDQSDN